MRESGVPQAVETEADACAVLVARLGALPQGHEVKASRVGGSHLWNVNAVDEQGRGYVGTRYIVGPDGRLWTFRSNPSIHDPDLADAVLAALYAKGVADRVEDDHLAAFIASRTAQKAEWVHQAVEQATSGGLRSTSPRALP